MGLPFFFFVSTVTMATIAHFCHIHFKKILLLLTQLMGFFQNKGARKLTHLCKKA